MKKETLLFIAFVLVVILYVIWYISELNKPMFSPLSKPRAVQIVKPVEAVEEWVGEASWYGTGKGECLGCSKSLIMANGQRLDDSKFTVACGIKSSCKYLKLGTKILITNLKNSKQVEVVVTDKGGLRQGRLLDVSKAVKNALDMGGLGKVSFKIIN